MSIIRPYPNLTERLLDADKHPDPFVAYALATLAAYAYSDQATVSEIANKLGLEDYRCQTYQQYVDVMFIDSTAYLLQSADGRVVILAYRGTTLMSAINWLTNLEVDIEKVEIAFDDLPGTFNIHRGYHRNVLATFDDVVGALGRALNKQSVTLNGDGEATPVDEAMQALYITGHSLGAGMAAMTALLLRTDRAYRDIFKTLKPVYTFGQPMIGDHQFAARCDEPDVLGGKLIRYVFGHDSGAQLPPTASGDFAHFGRQFSHPSNETRGDWRESASTKQLHNLLALAVLVPSFLARQFRLTRHLRFGISVDDHLPKHYIATLTPPDDEAPAPPRTRARTSIAR
jgi:hypothetical protein